MNTTYDLATDVGRVRLLIGDTDVEDAVYTDPEIETFLSLEGDVESAAAMALESMAATAAQTAHELQIGDYREVLYVKSREMREMAKQLRERARTKPAVAFTRRVWDGPAGFAGMDLIIRKALRGEL